MKTLLLTSFTTWKPHQSSNSSDDVLEIVQRTRTDPALHFLRQLPVDFKLAPEKVIAHIDQLQPDLVLCWGMAETRSCLNLEYQAVQGDRVLTTGLDLHSLSDGLAMTHISDDAGRFLCNALYYAVLHHLRSHHPDRHALFIHVPILTPENRETMVGDVHGLLDRLRQS